MKSLFLRKQVSKRVENGHPWVYGNEVNPGKELDAAARPGEIVNLFTHDRKFVGRGYYNPKSQIVLRLLTRDVNQSIDAPFFERRISEAWAYRCRLGYTENCRLVFGEADGLPQLIVDKFNDYFVVQTLALGIDIWKPAIVEALQKLFSPAGIYERNDVPVRELEGLPQQKGFLSEPFDTSIIINENGMRMKVDLENGQKTGYFLDQQDNRRAIAPVVKDADVLGAFCYTGSFEVAAALWGAARVTGVDVSDKAVALCSENAALNGVGDRCDFVCANAFDRLREWVKEGRQWDVVMLDPPSFTKSRGALDKALAGYKEINLRGMKLVRPGGFLVTSSCTNLVSPDRFRATVAQAALDARRQLRQVMYRSQSPDHPVVPGWENTEYLKFLVVQVG
jgi:23S rRNA (cytosine1962-C5)-methyltransferase